MEQHAGQIDEKAIRAKAHELWVKRGCPTDTAEKEKDWYEAERILRAELQGQSTAAKPSSSSKAEIKADIEDDEPTPTRKRRW